MFDGKWTVRAGASGTFELNLLLLGSGALFGEIADGNDTDKGTVRGQPSDPLHAQVKLNQPGLNRTGTITIALSSDGSTFTGRGTLSDNQPVTWQGTKSTAGAAGATGAAGAAQSTQVPPKGGTPNPFLGSWQVTSGDGSQFLMNLRGKTDGVTTALLGLIRAQGSSSGTVRGSLSNADKSAVHLTFAMSGSKGDVDLTLTPDGRSFIGAGHLADGTPITWKGARASAAAPR